MTEDSGADLESIFQSCYARLSYICFQRAAKNLLDRSISQFFCWSSSVDPPFHLRRNGLASVMYRRTSNAHKPVSRQ